MPFSSAPSSNSGTSGGGGGGGVPSMFSNTYLPRFTGLVRVGLLVSVSTLAIVENAAAVLRARLIGGQLSPCGTCRLRRRRMP